MTPVLAKTIFVLCVVAWYIIRRPHARRSRRTPVQTSARGVRERVLIASAFIGLGIVPALYIFARFPRFADYPFVPALAWLGTLTFGAALWLFYLTHKELGRNWSISLELRENQTLVMSGVYSRIRHPMYTAFWLWAIAQALLLPNWIAGPAGLLGFGILYVLRVRAEERLMLERFGEQYRAYMSRTGRLVPWLH
jgi:protein-S-isoprenylcysteine O-methyltransferase Ste14